MRRLRDRGLSRSVTVLLLALVPACTVADVDYAGMRCSADAPCPSGWACVSGACQLPAKGQQACTPHFTVTDFHRVWSTPAGIRWGWTPVGNKVDFVEYKLVLGKTDTELAAALAKAEKGENDGVGGQIWTQEDNPELGQYELRLSGNTDLIQATTTDGLDQGQEYRARLLAYDASGCAFESDVAVASTGVASSMDATLFDDAPHPHGYPRPSGLAPNTVAATIASDPGQAFEGSKYLLWPGWPKDGSVNPGDYYENVGIDGLKTSPTQDYPLLDFSVAYLETAIAVDGPLLATWGEVRLMLGPAPGDCSTKDVWEVKPYTFRPTGNYQLIQIPLDQFTLGGNVLDAATVKSHSICEVSFGSGWGLGVPVRVDSIRVRW